MSKKSVYLVDLIFKKLKKYKSKEIILEKENLKKFINSLMKENWLKGRAKLKAAIVKLKY